VTCSRRLEFLDGFFNYCICSVLGFLIFISVRGIGLEVPVCRVLPLRFILTFIVIWTLRSALRVLFLFSVFFPLGFDP